MEEQAIVLEDDLVLIASASYALIREYSLVLASQGVVHHISESPLGPFEIIVSASEAKHARRQIRLYRFENPPRVSNPPLPVAMSLAPFWILSVPIACTLLQFSGLVAGFTNRGIADASLINRGEWWRVFTALTLHGDAKHILGNLLSGFFVLNLISFRIRLSRMALPLLCTAGLANWFVAFTVQQDFRSLGFSTFVFAALGALSSIEVRLMPRETYGLSRGFAPLFGAILLAVFMGVGENSDILAHGYGFVLGLATGFLPRKKTLHWGTKSSYIDVTLFVLYFCLFLVSWALALH